MSLYTYSTLAENDLVEIGTYTLARWGTTQTEKYLNQLEDCCRMIAQNPRVGRPWRETPLRIRRLEQGKHVIFYQQQDAGIFIARILHQSMLPTHHPMEDPT